MKRIIYFSLFALFIVSCKTKEDNGMNVENDHSTAESSHIHLNPTQIAKAGIQVESIAKHKIRDHISVTGTIEVPPQSKATIYAPMNAFVYNASLLPGDYVKKGQTIATLQHPDFTKLQYRYIEAVNNRNVLKADYERKKMLLENDIASKKSFELSKSSYDSSQSLVESLVSQLKMVGLNPSNVLKNGIQQYIYIKAPISGYVTESNLNIGKLLGENDEMMEIIDTEHMHAELNVFSTDINKVKKGMDFTFTPTGVDKVYEGYVKLVSKAVNTQTKTVNVHGHFEDAEGILKASTFINAKILVNAKDVYAIPEAAIVDIEGEQFVFSVIESGEYEPVKITTGNTDKGYVALSTIDKNNFKLNIVTNGAHYLKGKLLEQSGEMEGHAH